MMIHNMIASVMMHKRYFSGGRLLNLYCCSTFIFFARATSGVERGACMGVVFPFSNELRLPLSKLEFYSELSLLQQLEP